MKSTHHTDNHGFDVPDQKEPQTIFNPDAKIEQQLNRGITVQAEKPKPQPQIPAEVEAEELPHDLKSAFALLKQANDACVEQEIVTETIDGVKITEVGERLVLSKAEFAKRQARLNRIRAHVFDLQQGLPTLNVRVSPNAPNEVVMRMASEIEQKISRSTQNQIIA